MPPNKDAPGCFGSPPGLICLPPISEDLQLVWTQAAQTSDLDGNQHLLQTFSYFPYPSLSDLALLCLRHGLHMEKVKAWFMVQRLRCGISWSAEEIEETRARLIYHQDQLHFSSLLSGSDGGSWHQPCKAQEYYQPVPTSVHQPSKYLQNQQACMAPLSHCSPAAQGMRVLGRVSQDTWEPKGSAVPHYYKAQENCEPSGTSMYFYNTKEMNSGLHLPAPPPGPDYKFQNSHATAWRHDRAPLQPPEPVLPAVNGEPHSVRHPPGPPAKAAPPPHVPSAVGVEPCGLQSCQYPAGDPPQTPGSVPDVLRKPRRKTKEQLDMLKSFFLHCQWARREDYFELERITGLPRSEIIQWFGDTRYALKHGQLKWFRDNAKQSPESASLFPLLPLQAGQPSTVPLERYWAAHGQLQECDLPVLCRESGMEAEQVLKWFHSRLPAPCEVEVCLGDEDEVDEEVAAAMVKEDDEDYEEEEEEEDNEEEEEEEEEDKDWTA